METGGDRTAAADIALLQERLRTLVNPAQHAAVAFSGGTDSAFLLAVAARALGPPAVVAVTAVSPSLSAAELAHARDFADRLGVRHLLPQSNELADPGYSANSPARCFHCKTEVVDVVGRVAADVGSAGVVVMTGTNADDLRSDFRPGIAAARRLGAVTPLAEFSKRRIRELSRHLGLTTWDKPAQACLASRIAYGVPISPSNLLRVQRAESALREIFATLGVPVVNLRVRDLGDDRARLEVDADLVPTVADDIRVVAAIRQTGFATVEVDPRGFRSGSMNEALRPG